MFLGLNRRNRLSCRLPRAGVCTARLVVFVVAVVAVFTGCDRSDTRTAAPAVAAGERVDRSVRPPNVLLISMDTTRADHLGCYGHATVRTPHVDRLASEGVAFLQCTSPAPLTLPSHCSMMTGTYPFVHGARDNSMFWLHPDNLTLAEVLKEAGYVTGAEVAAFVLNREFGLNQGFEAYGDVYSTVAGANDAGRFTAERKAEEVCDSALRWLRANAGRPFYLFVHFFDPHHPYEPPERFQRQYVNPYLGEIAYVDEQVGRLLGTLRELELLDQTLLVLTSDHGEGCGQHGESSHATFIYDSTVSVPLIFRYPALLPAGQRVVAQVRLVDIAPTILALLDMEPLPDAQGVSLRTLMTGERDDLHLAAYSESFYPRYNYGFSHLRAWRAGGWKYIHAPKPELYHISADPDEQRNLAAAQPERTAQMRAALRGLISESPAVIGSGDARIAMTAESIKALRSLGYVAGASGEASADGGDDELDYFDPRGPDPKDHGDLVDLVGRALDLLQRGHPDAERVLRECIARAPNPDVGFAWAYTNLADLLAKQGRHEDALEWYRRAARACPEDSRTLFALGEGLSRTGRIDQAIAAYEAALQTKPVLARTHCALAAALAVQGRVEDAIEHLRRALEINANLIHAHRTLGRLCAGSGHVAEAVAAYERAVALGPDDVDSRQALARLLARQGDKTAVDHYQEILRAHRDSAAAHAGLGEVYYLLGEVNEAAGSFRRALELDPKFLAAYDALGALLRQQGRFTEAIRVRRRGLEVAPEHPNMANNLAWLLATAPAPALRDGAEAVRLAQLACRASQEQNFNFLDTLAAAYAEVGRFDEAIRTVDSAIALAEGQGQAQQVTEMQSRRRLYAEGKPYHVKR